MPERIDIFGDMIGEGYPVLLAAIITELPQWDEAGKRMKPLSPERRAEWENLLRHVLDWVYPESCGDDGENSPEPTRPSPVHRLPQPPMIMLGNGEPLSRAEWLRGVIVDLLQDGTPRFPYQIREYLQDRYPDIPLLDHDTTSAIQVLHRNGMVTNVQHGWTIRKEDAPPEPCAHYWRKRTTLGGATKTTCTKCGASPAAPKGEP